MKREKIDRLTSAHGATTRRPRKATEAPPEPPSPTPEIETDLDDPKTQDLILHPEGTSVALSYETVQLYPPSMMIRKLGHAYCRKMLLDAAETKPTTLEIYVETIPTIVMGSVGSMMRLFKLVSYLCGRPGEVSDADSDAFAQEFANKTNEDDVAILFATLCKACGINKDASQAKN